MTAAAIVLAVALSGTPLDVRDGREGIIAHTGSDASYTAIPLGPGIRIEVCAVTCLERVSSDAGPNRAMLQAGRIMDVDRPTFISLCQCPASTGLIHGSWRVLGRGSVPRPTLPATDAWPVPVTMWGAR